MLGLSTLRGSNAESPHHVYELRLYHVNEGKMDALKARFGNYTDSIFKRHNMKSIGYWSPEDAPSSQNLFIYILEHPSRQEGEKNWAAFQADPEWRYVAVRRTALLIEQSLSRGTQWAALEPNDALLWQRLRRDVEAFS